MTSRVILCVFFMNITLCCISAEHALFEFTYISNDEGLTHNTVFDICQDNKGFMWFATEVGLNRYDGQKIKQYYHSSTNNRSLPARTVTCLTYTSDNKMFVGTIKGLAVYSTETDDFEHISFSDKIVNSSFISIEQGDEYELLISTANKGAYVFNYKDNIISKLQIDEHIYRITKDLNDNYWAFSQHSLYQLNRKGEAISISNVFQAPLESTISCIYIDKQNTLWVGTLENGLYTLDSSRRQFQQLELCKKNRMHYIRVIEEAENPNEYWIGTENGLYLINVNKNTYRHYTQSFDSKHNTINDNAIYKIFQNKQGIVFAGTYFGGVNVIKPCHMGFNAMMPENGFGSLQGKAIGMMAEMPNGDIWIATEDAGIAVFDVDKYTFSHMRFNEKNPNSIASDNVHALLIDGAICWSGHFMGGISKIDTNTGKIKRFINKENDVTSLSSHFVLALHFISPDSILVSTHTGVDLFDKRTEKFYRFRENEFAGNFIIETFTDPDGKIWFCSYNNGIYILDKSCIGLMKHFQVGDKSGLTSNSVISYCIDSKKQIWLGTRENGLLKYISEEQRFIQCKTDMLNDDIVYGILEDDDHYLWISTNKGISRLNFVDSTSVHFTIKHGIASNQHNYKSYFKHKNKLYFGSVKGFTWFDPNAIFIAKETPLVYFSNLKIFNTIITVDTLGPLNKQIDLIEYLELKHNQNSFTLEFASINYLSNDIKYQYYLEGLENTWLPLSDKEQVNYTNIPPGNYVFHVRAMNIINRTVSNERALIVVIKPPYWKSRIAYLLYCALIIAITYFLSKNYHNRQREKMALALEKIEKENLKLLNRHKINFFTYITHEFKTPLSIIITSVEILIKKKNIERNNNIEEMLLTVKRSANQLLSLINQLMEFRKIETDHAVIQNTKGNIIDFYYQIIDSYRPLFIKKNIEIKNNTRYTSAEMFTDFGKLEKIISNLLTNAVKYTPQNGKIELKLEIKGDLFLFSVKDSGCGISKEKKNKIFEAFYSEDISNEIVESSGIGLALTASLVKLLNGQITLESEENKGSEFIVKIPFIKGSESSEEQEIIIEEEDKSMKEYTIIIVEDNKDLLSLLNKNFRDKYRVKCFGNGKEALCFINEKIPDLIISDIMMPEIDGIELCKLIKSNENTCHIPIIILTAKDTKEAKIEGLQIGADAYIFKPFSMEELEIRIKNMLLTRHYLKRQLNKLARFEEFDIPKNNNGQIFLEKIYALIIDNIENEKLCVQFLSEQMNISRPTLNEKMKVVVNMTTSEFIKTVKINKAKEYILKSELSLSEIAYKVGYYDPAHFTRVFKSYTNQTPGEFKFSNDLK